MTLTLVSLFDGIGGFPLAFERAGAETVATVEIDDAAAKISHRHFPHAHQFTDVTKVTGDDLRTVGFVPERGIITAGWPCQDLSVAGRREGLAGARSGLWWHVVRLLAETQPRWFVGENVPGLLSSNGGRDFGAVLGSLAELGYGFAYRVLDAQHFGVPQRRRRVFIVGHLGAPFGAAAEVLFEPKSGDRDSASGDAAGPGVAGGITDSVGAACCATGTTHTHTLTASAAKMVSEDGTGRGIPIVTRDTHTRSRRCRAAGNADTGSTPNQQQASTSSFNRNVVAALTSNGVGTVGPDDNQAQAGHLVPQSVYPLAVRGRDGGAMLEVGPEDGPYNALRAGDGGSSRNALVAVATPISMQNATRATTKKPSRAGDSSGTGVGEPDEPSFTITSTTPAVATGFHATQDPISSTERVPAIGAESIGNGVQHDTIVRRLTEMECERLQGYPDDWTAGQSGAARYRQLGNSVAVPVVQWIAERLITVDKEQP